LPCPDGTFQVLNGQQVCVSCGIGKQGVNGVSPRVFTNTACQSCNAGTYCGPNDHPCADCLACPDGTYQDESGQPSCKSCPIGYSGNDNLNERYSQATGCVACPGGTYQDQTGQQSCANCPPGYGGVNGLTDGQRTSLSVACGPCPAGKYCGTNDVPCVDCIWCPDGRWQNLTGQLTCNLCPGGTAGANTNSARISLETGCLACSTGSYGNQLGLASCVGCADGRYQDLTGQTMCKYCPAGYGGTDYPSGSTARKSIATGCTACPEGQYQPSTGAANCNYCTYCKQGTDGLSDGQRTTLAISCTQCPPSSCPEPWRNDLTHATCG
jgi:hypothetical protein